MMESQHRVHARIGRHLVLALCASLALLATRARAGDDAFAPKDRWYIVEMFGGRAGFAHMTSREVDGNIVSTTEMRFELGRGDAAIRMGMTSEFVETRAGKPVSMRKSNIEGKATRTQSWRFVEDGVEVESEEGGRVQRSKKPRPEGNWLAPAAAERYAVSKFLEGAKSIEVTTIDPMLDLTPITQKREVAGPEVIKVDGQEVSAIKTSVSTSQFPNLKSTDYLDAQGELIRSETDFGGMQVVMTASTRERALAKDGRPTPEVMVSTLVTPDRPIRAPRTLRRAVFALSAMEGELPDVPTGGAQVFERTDTGGIVTVDLSHSGASAEEADDERFLAATPMADANDTPIQELAASATKNAGKDPAQRAESIRRAVYRHIENKDLGLALATASQAVREKHGDCTEHACLMVATLRAAGIPARAATGVVYAEEFGGKKQVFGYHMWAQALLGDGKDRRWVDLDAAISPSTPFDATHIALAYTDLSEGDAIDALSNVAAVLGRLKIEVREPVPTSGPANPKP